MPKLDRLARSVPDARASLRPGRPHGDNILATFAEFEGDLPRMCTREGMAVAGAKGKLRAKQPKLSPKQQAELRRMRATSDTDPTELFPVSRPTVYRTLQRGSASTKTG